MTAERGPNDDERGRRIAEIRRLIATGEYDTPERLDAALDALLASGRLAATNHDHAARIGDGLSGDAPPSDFDISRPPNPAPTRPPHFRRPR